jgi:2-polyprenyl-3-methyl-5-hydroxy-6-metoxy-1,4-benzoquinol methylase
MTEQISICPLCSGQPNKTPLSRPFDQRVFHGMPVTNRICVACGFVFQTPRMTETELKEFYAAEYRRIYQGREEPVAKDLAVQTQRAKVLLHFIQTFMPGSAPLNGDSLFLDIGCSTGKLLECFAQTFGCRVVGIEPGDAYRREDQRRGLDVYASLDGLKQSGQYPCDLVSLIHVLEHLPNPVQYLTHLRQDLLHPNGWLLVEVPNLYAHECFEVAHLTSYSTHTLTQTLKQAGFEIVALRKHGAPRSRLLPLYITILARPLPKPLPQAVSPERGVEYKRRVGMLRRRVVSRLFPSLAWIPIS